MCRSRFASLLPSCHTFGLSLSFPRFLWLSFSLLPSLSVCRIHRLSFLPRNTTIKLFTTQFAPMYACCAFNRMLFSFDSNELLKSYIVDMVGICRYSNESFSYPHYQFPWCLFRLKRRSAERTESIFENFDISSVFQKFTHTLCNV